MVSNQFVDKSELFALLREIFAQGESGMLTLLTDAKKSVLMRFSKGELTSARCRSWDIENTIEALRETENVKYSYIPSSVEDKPQLLAAKDFMMMVDPDGQDLKVEEKLVVTQEEIIEEPEVLEVVTAKEDNQVGRDVDRAIAAKMNFF